MSRPAASRYAFSDRSRGRLATCAPDLRRVIERALGAGIIDFSVVEGHRPVERQLALYASGRTAPGPVVTQIDGIRRKSCHNHDPARAVDVRPWLGSGVEPADAHWGLLAGVVLASAAAEGVPVRWGGDWDGNPATRHSFVDMPHFELREA